MRIADMTDIIIPSGKHLSAVIALMLVDIVVASNMTTEVASLIEYLFAQLARKHLLQFFLILEGLVLTNVTCFKYEHWKR
jgi:hypothetical protein